MSRKESITDDWKNTIHLDIWLLAVIPLQQVVLRRPKELGEQEWHIAVS